MGKVIKGAATIIPDEVWIVETTFGNLLRYYYAGVGAEDEAVRLAGVHAIGESISNMRRVRNAEAVKLGEWREFRTGP